MSGKRKNHDDIRYWMWDQMRLSSCKKVVSFFRLRIDYFTLRKTLSPEGIRRD